MKKLLIPLLFAFPLIAHSQTIYTIPWATKQPKFVFPIFIEEGGGQRDTLYLGYDPNASVISFDTASLDFGVVTTHVDTYLLYAMWYACLYFGAITFFTVVY